ncbi:unnamed protein product, partial [marine sediment metagenome]
KEAARMVATLMASSARTAPKAGGIDNIETMILDDGDLDTLAHAMEEKAIEQPPHVAEFVKSDAGTVRKSLGVLLVGVTGVPNIDQPLDCGSCGYGSCRQLLAARTRSGRDFDGPVCIIKAIDLGIALGSAAKLASELNVDNRIMYSIGTAAKKLGLLEADIIHGIPLSITGKSPFFDRP